jgi:hypothetical protein
MRAREGRDAAQPGQAGAQRRRRSPVPNLAASPPGSWARAGTAAQGAVRHARAHRRPSGVNPSNTTYVAVTSRLWNDCDWRRNARRTDGPWADVRGYDADDLEDLAGTRSERSLLDLRAARPGAPRRQDPGLVVARWSRRTRLVLPRGFLLAGRDETVSERQHALGQPPQPITVVGPSREEALTIVLQAASATVRRWAYPSQRRAWLETQLQQLYPGCTITVTITPPSGDPPHGHVPEAALPPRTASQLTRLREPPSTLTALPRGRRAPPPAAAARPAGPSFRLSARLSATISGVKGKRFSGNHDFRLLSIEVAIPSADAGSCHGDADRRGSRSVVLVHGGLGAAAATAKAASAGSISPACGTSAGVDVRLRSKHMDVPRHTCGDQNVEICDHFLHESCRPCRRRARPLGVAWVRRWPVLGVARGRRGGDHRRVACSVAERGRACASGLGDSPSGLHPHVGIRPMHRKRVRGAATRAAGSRRSCGEGHVSQVVPEPS